MEHFDILDDYIGNKKKNILNKLQKEKVIIIPTLNNLHVFLIYFVAFLINKRYNFIGIYQNNVFFKSKNKIYNL